MLFKKFVEQHGVHLVVADGQRFAVFVARHQMGVYLFHFLCNETKAEWTRRFDLGLVAEAYRLKAVDGFAGLIDWLDVVLEAPGGYQRPEFTV